MGEFMDNIAVAKHFITATVNVLSTMAHIKPVAGKPFVKTNMIGLGDVSALVGLTGAKSGSIAVTFPKATAIGVVRGMLGDDIQDIINDTKDTVGEICNMISGQARAHLAEAGMALQGSTPTIVFGDNHSISHISSAAVVAIPFTSDAGGFIVEFCFES